MKSFLMTARVALTLTVLAAAPAMAAGTGTLPLKINAGTGTLPLKMSGVAQSMVTPGSTVQTQMVLTQASQPAMDPASAAGLNCKLAGDVSKHAAQGTITVASGTYTVVGICYNGDTKVMEVVGRRSGGAEESFLTGQLLVETPKKFSGRLTVAGATAQAGRYTFDIKCNDANR